MDIRVRDHMQDLSHKSHNEPSLGPLSLVLSGEKKKKVTNMLVHTHSFEKKKILFWSFSI